MQNKSFHYAALITSLTLIAVCFMPWVHYNSIDKTFSGYNVTTFATGVYYGKAGIIITVFSILILILNLLKGTVAKNANLFVCALLVAYTFRTYILFTGSLFEGQVVKYAGIYLIVILSIVLLVCALFPLTASKQKTAEKRQ